MNFGLSFFQVVMTHDFIALAEYVRKDTCTYTAVGASLWQLFRKTIPVEHKRVILFHRIYVLACVFKLYLYATSFDARSCMSGFRGLHVDLSDCF